MNLMPFVISWAVLATVVLGLVIYRRGVANKEDDFLHVDGHTAAQQEAIAKKLDSIDKWGKTLTVIAFVYALVILSVFLYNGWTESSRIVQ